MSSAQQVSFESRVSSLEAFLKDLFTGFEREGIDYALAREYGPLPASLDSRDLDLFVGDGQLERAYQVTKAIAQMHSATVLRINQESAMWLLVVSSTLSWALRVDIAATDSHTWRGIPYLNLDRAFHRKIQEEGIYRLRADDVVLIQFCRDIIGRHRLREKYRSAIHSICVNDALSFEKHLAEMFGQQCAAALSEACRKGSFDGLESVGKQMRRAVIVRSLTRRPLETAGRMLRYVGGRCREYMRPNGVMIAVIGPDGSGKGALIDKANQWMRGPLHFPTRVYHLRPGLLPSLGALLLGRKDDDTPVPDPHAQEPSGFIFSLLRLAYYTLDYLLGYWWIVRPRLGRKCIAVMFDRYFYDWLIDPIRCRISLPQWVIRAFAIFVHKPDLVVLLSAGPEVIHNRKPELPLHEIRRQFSEMDRLAHFMGRCIWIDTCKPLQDSGRDMIRAIFRSLEKRLL